MKRPVHYETPCRLCQKQESVSSLDHIARSNHFKVFRCTNHCQGQMKTPQSLSVLHLRNVAYSRYDEI